MATFNSPITIILSLISKIYTHISICFELASKNNPCQIYIHTYMQIYPFTYINKYTLLIHTQAYSHILYAAHKYSIHTYTQSTSYTYSYLLPVERASVVAIRSYSHIPVVSNTTSTTSYVYYKQQHHNNMSLVTIQTYHTYNMYTFIYPITLMLPLDITHIYIHISIHLNPAYNYNPSMI